MLCFHSAQLTDKKSLATPATMVSCGFHKLASLSFTNSAFDERCNLSSSSSSHELTLTAQASCV